MERETVERAAGVVLVTDTWTNAMRARYADLPPEKFVCIPNGFDPAAFRTFRSRPHAGPGFLVAYIGTVYSTTSPRYYLDVLDSLPEGVRRSVETRFVGRIADDQRALLEGRSSLVKLLGFMPQQEALRHAEEADFLLLTMSDPAAATGKIYEYLAMGKPILAIAPADGEVDRIVRSTAAGWCAPPDDPAAIESMLLRAFDPGRELLESFRPDRDAIRAYERPSIARSYAELITGRLDQSVAPVLDGGGSRSYKPQSGT
jgi:glycosyltransferase involved in cell wall biosynthesis